jgi:flagellar biosynthesis protein FliQ
MNVDQATDLIRHTLLLALTISAPDAADRSCCRDHRLAVPGGDADPEQTLTFIPKIAAMTVAAIVLMPWIAQRLLDYHVDRCSRMD